MSSAVIAAVWCIGASMSGAAAKGNGAITFVTASDAYLNVGHDDGLAAGTELTILRRGRKVGTCTVKDVSKSRASCQAKDLERGDRFTFTTVPPPAPPPPVDLTMAEPKTIAPVPTRDELAAKRAAVVAVPLEKVHHLRSSPQVDGYGRVALRAQYWSINSRDDAYFGRGSLDAAARGGLSLLPVPHVVGEAAVRVVGDVLAPVDQRGRPGDLVELYVFRANIGVDDGWVVGQLGRIAGRRVPGLPILDGAQAGVRPLDGPVEAGVYAGLIPDVVTLQPALRRAAFGTYATLDALFLDGLMLSPRLRLGALSTADFSTVRGELELDTEVQYRSIVRVGGVVKASAGADGATLDAARVDGNLQLASFLRLGAGYHYLRPLAFDIDAVSQVPPVDGEHHADSDVAFQPLPWLVVGGMAGVGFDPKTQTTRGWVGPTLGWPTAFGTFGGMDLGYLEELGEWPGRSAWVGARFAPASVLTAFGRVSYFEVEATDDSYREVCGIVGADAPILPWLTLRAHLLLEQTLPSLGQAPRDRPTAALVDASVIGAF